MFATVIKAAAGYVATPMLQRSKSFRNWLIAVHNGRRLQRLIKQQRFPQPVNTVLVVCKGNICRSPFAEAYLKDGLARCQVSVHVFSAGLETVVGKPAHNLAQLVGRNLGIPLEAHLTQPLLKEHVERADLIVAMEPAHLYRLHKLYPQCLRKTFLLRQFISRNTKRAHEVEITDPYSGTVNDFQECFAIITESCDQLIREICRANAHA